MIQNSQIYDSEPIILGFRTQSSRIQSRQIQDSGPRSSVQSLQIQDSGPRFRIQYQDLGFRTRIQDSEPINLGFRKARSRIQNIQIQNMQHLAYVRRINNFCKKNRGNIFSFSTKKYGIMYHYFRNKSNFIKLFYNLL